jgi:hypothetical protein
LQKSTSLQMIPHVPILESIISSNMLAGWDAARCYPISLRLVRTLVGKMRISRILAVFGMMLDQQISQ